jgi:hypothetical protein
MENISMVHSTVLGGAEGLDPSKQSASRYRDPFNRALQGHSPAMSYAMPAVSKFKDSPGRQPGFEFVVTVKARLLSQPQFVAHSYQHSVKRVAYVIMTPHVSESWGTDSQES